MHLWRNGSISYSAWDRFAVPTKNEFPSSYDSLRATIQRQFLEKIRSDSDLRKSARLQKDS